MPTPRTDDSLFIIWSSSDPDVAHNLAFMYSHNSLKRGWWKQVRLVIWGPSAKLVSQDPDIQARIREMLDDGVEVWACKACADIYDISQDLGELGINVFHVGEAVTKMLKSGWKQFAL
jgi:hypothetical protein